MRLRKIKLRRLGNKEKEWDTKDNKIDEKNKIVALLLQKVMPFRPLSQKVKKRSNITIIRDERFYDYLLLLE